ncbi:MAG: DUF4160 domain-containing protein [Candidatus Omnitrophica bacterium]|nr:DUF4160 domain-containing protein [Candidatus Omnitrophota bacterium]
MPTILEIMGWRLFFYTNESQEPPHIHAKKAGMECKFWIKVKYYDIEEAYAFGLKVRDKREIRKIIFDHFDYIVERWDAIHREGKHE